MLLRSMFILLKIMHSQNDETGALEAMYKSKYSSLLNHGGETCREFFGIFSIDFTLS